MKLVDLVSLNIQLTGNWAIFGPEAADFEDRLSACLPRLDRVDPTGLSGLLLVGALSRTPPDRTEGWLADIATAMPEMATLVVADWQADGPPAYGPDHGLRFKKGRLCRLLRSLGFGQIETLDHQPLYYVVRLVKGPPLHSLYWDRFGPVVRLDELPANGLKKVTLFDQKIVVANTGRQIVAFAQACPHGAGALDQGRLRRCNLACPLHGYIWNVCTGQPLFPEDEDILPRYTVKIEDNQIWVALKPPDQK